MNITLHDIDELGDQHRHQKLFELASKYNDDHPELPIDLTKCQTSDQLLFSLWSRNVDVGVLGLGHPYDEALTTWRLPVTNIQYDLNDMFIYRVYLNRNQLVDFLFYSLLLPKTLGVSMMNNNKSLQLI